MDRKLFIYQQSLFADFQRISRVDLCVKPLLLDAAIFALQQPLQIGRPRRFPAQSIQQCESAKGKGESAALWQVTF